MVLGLLTASLISIISLGATIFIGFAMPGSGDVRQHFLFGLFTAFMVTFSQSMTMFFFIGMGKQIKDLVTSHTLSPQLIQRTKVFKARVFPPALWAMLFTMAVWVVGGGVDTRTIPTWIHTLLAALALFFNLKAFWVELRFLGEHNLLMQELDRLLASATEAK